MAGPSFALLCVACSFILKIEVMGSSKMVLNFYQTVGWYIPKDCSLYVIYL